MLHFVINVSLVMVLLISIQILLRTTLQRQLSCSPFKFTCGSKSKEVIELSFGKEGIPLYNNTSRGKLKQMSHVCSLKH